MTNENARYSSFVKTMIYRENLRHEMRDARKQKDWGALRDDATALLKSDPDDLDAQVAIGESYEKEGQIDLAVQAYERALPLEGHGSAAAASVAFKRLDILYTRAGRYDDSLRVCRLYTERFPDSWDAWNRLRRAARNAGDGELALTAGSEADGIRFEREYRRERNRARGARLLELYEARLAELGIDPEESSGDPRGSKQAGSRPPEGSLTNEAVEEWLNSSIADSQARAKAKEQAFLDAVQQLLEEAIDADEAEDLM